MNKRKDLDLPKSTGDKGIHYLLHEYSGDYRFRPKPRDAEGYDLVCLGPGGEKYLAEVKTTERTYKKPSDIGKDLVFSREPEIRLFESGVGIVVRVFLGNTPHRIFIFDNSVQRGGRELQADPRARLKGRIDWDKARKIQ
jgi:hypothetical protein